VSSWLIGLVGGIYLYVGLEMLLTGRHWLAVVWLGYAFSQVGLWALSR
jgi:hypothetical protein